VFAGFEVLREGDLEVLVVGVEQAVGGAGGAEGSAVDAVGDAEDPAALVTRAGGDPGALDLDVVDRRALVVDDEGGADDFIGAGAGRAVAGRERVSRSPRPLPTFARWS